MGGVVLVLQAPGAGSLDMPQVPSVVGAGVVVAGVLGVGEWPDEQGKQQGVHGGVGWGVCDW